MLATCELLERTTKVVVRLVSVWMQQVALEQAMKVETSYSLAFVHYTSTVAACLDP